MPYSDHDHDWRAPSPSTPTCHATALYRSAVVAIVAGTGDANQYLADAVVADPGFYLATVAAALCWALRGHPFTAPIPIRPIHRWERQHGEIVDAAFGGDATRADDLRREHLLEYPGDLLIVWLPAACRTS